ncbi:MAG: YdcF family protein [Verrucomicrobia bacterium]|nr:YdcF family protein [Verrucomicrobiota bacterium]
MAIRSRSSFFVKICTIRGWILVGFFCVLLPVVPGTIWLWRSGESYFSLTRRLPADVLVVEGWLGFYGYDGILAAAKEFERGNYKYIVTTGGLRENQMVQGPRNYAEMAKQALVRFGIPQDRILAAPTEGIEHERTYKSAVAAWNALRESGIRPAVLNVFTLGPHARRSQLVYEKVFTPDSRVGVIAWAPPSYETEGWWRSRTRIKCLLKETVGYPFEVLFNSGRTSNSAGKAAYADLRAASGSGAAIVESR